jgi:hypothetical protein
VEKNNMPFNLVRGRGPFGEDGAWYETKSILAVHG